MKSGQFFWYKCRRCDAGGLSLDDMKFVAFLGVIMVACNTCIDAWHTYQELYGEEGEEL